MTPDLAAGLAALERQLATVAPQDAPALLGELERLKATLWAKMLNASANQNRQPEASADDLQHLSVLQVAAMARPASGARVRTDQEGRTPRRAVREERPRPVRRPAGAPGPAPRKGAGQADVHVVQSLQGQAG